MSIDSLSKHGIFARFLRFLWRSLKAFNTIVFGLISLILFAVVIYAIINQRGLKIPTSAALVLNPAGTLVEQKTATGAAALIQGNDVPQETLVKDLIDALILARDDSRIGLVVLDLGQLNSGLLPKLERISAAIKDFKASGKKVIAVADNYSQSAIYLAAQADEVLLNPEGMAIPEGFAMHRTYFKSFLEKHDVTVNLFKVGKYKSAVDTYFRDDMSQEDRTARSEILDAWWQAYTTGIETARGLSAGSINVMLQNAPEQIRLVDGNLARLSLEKGLVDRLVTETEQREYLIELAGKDSENNDYKKVSYSDYLYIARLSKEPQADKVAVITAVGPILDGDVPAGEIGSKSLSRLIRKAQLDTDVKAIVLRIDSGGGSKSASEHIRSALQAVQASGIPVVASMGSVAASGGYWIAASSDEIWASPTTVTGSIGIFGLLPSFENTLANYGIYSDGVATTPIAGGASALRGISPAYGEVLQSVVDAGYQQFLTTVADGRRMDVNAVHEVAQGRIWTGRRAQELGLVDELGDLDQAVSAAARLADIDNYSVWYVEQELSVEEELLRKLTESISDNVLTILNTPVSQVMSMVQEQLGFLARLNDPRNVYVICSECVELRW